MPALNYNLWPGGRLFLLLFCLLIGQKQRTFLPASAQHQCGHYQQQCFFSDHRFF